MYMHHTHTHTYADVDAQPRSHSRTHGTDTTCCEWARSWEQTYENNRVYVCTYTNADRHIPHAVLIPLCCEWAGSGS